MKLFRSVNLRWIPYCLVLSIGLLLVHVTPSAALDVLTLEESLKIALERSPRVLVTASQERQSEAQVDEARSMLRPNLNLVGGLERTSPMPTGVNPGPPPFVQMGDPSSELDVTLAYNQVFNWGKETRLTLDQSELGLRLARLQQEGERLSVVTDVIKGYLGVLEATSALELSEMMARVSSEGARIAADRLAVGTATEADVIAAEAAMARAQQGVRIARDSVALARDALFQTIGLEGSERDAFKDVSLESIEDLADILVVDENLDALVERALASRVEVLQAELALEMAKLALEQFEASTKPRAELTGMYAWKDDGPALTFSLSDRGVLGAAVNQSHMLDGTSSTPSSPEDIWQIGARVTWNISDGGANQSRREQLTEQIHQAEMRLADLRSALSMQLSSQYNEVVHAMQDLAVAEQELVESRTRYQATLQLLESGTSTQIALLQAEGDLTRAMHERASALARLIRAHTSLAAATGVTAGELVSLLASSK